MLALYTPNLSEIVVLLKFKTQSIDEKGALYLKNMLTLDTPNPIRVAIYSMFNT